MVITIGVISCLLCQWHAVCFAFMKPTALHSIPCLIVLLQRLSQVCCWWSAVHAKPPDPLDCSLLCLHSYYGPAKGCYDDLSAWCSCCSLAWKTDQLTSLKQSLGSFTKITIFVGLHLVFFVILLQPLSGDSLHLWHTLQAHRWPWCCATLCIMHGVIARHLHLVISWGQHQLERTKSPMLLSNIPGMLYQALTWYLWGSQYI